MIAYPQPDEYGAYYGQYVRLVSPDEDVWALLKREPDDLRALLANVPDEQANQHPAPGEWSIKEVMGHLCDGERILSYRALRIARGDATPLPGFEQDDYVRGTNFNARTLPDLLEEFSFQRRANLLSFTPLTADELTRRGTASNNPFTARALIYILAGHVLHHVESLRTTYGVGRRN
jgi:uncharacterized damage-inducible protein DinB